MFSCTKIRDEQTAHHHHHLFILEIFSENWFEYSLFHLRITSYFSFSIDVSLSFESTCDFHIFFLVSLHDFHTLCVQKREREKKKIVWVCLQSSICTIAFARSYTQCVHIRFIVEKNRQTERGEGKKKMQKRHREYLLILSFSRFFFLEYIYRLSFFFGLAFHPHRNKISRETSSF